MTTSYESIPVYKQLVVNAFGADEAVWMRASPFSSDQPAAWEKVKAIMIAHSEDDELLDSMQTQLMCKRAQKTQDCKDRLHFLHAKGKHDQIWEEGHELARLIEEALALL